jgi:2,4-dienoyl-CoA reductase-like NADH-dependent reductase (Old Yellow Enzyme family)
MWIALIASLVWPMAHATDAHHYQACDTLEASTACHSCSSSRANPTKLRDLKVEAALHSVASQVRERLFAVALPVIGVGGIETGRYIDASLSERLFSLAAVGRAILKDPLAWRRNQFEESPVKLNPALDSISARVV